MTTWRYQAVARTEGDETIFSFVEVYFDDNGRLLSWTGEIAPTGDTVTDLVETLHRMAADAKRWGVVDIASMRVGMQYEDLGAA